MGIGEKLKEIGERIDPNSLERRSFRGRLEQILGEKTGKFFVLDEFPNFDFRGVWAFPKGNVRSVSINQTSKEDGEKVFSLTLEMDEIAVGIESRSRSTLPFVMVKPGVTEEIPRLSVRSVQETEKILLEFGITVIGLVDAQNSPAKKPSSPLAVAPLSP